MGNELSVRQPTTSLLEQRSASAKLALARPTSAADALKATKQLVGSYAHLKPDQPAIFVASLASVLAQYPLGLVEECVDPRSGMARTVEFLSVASLVRWCDDRKAFYSALAAWEKPEEKPAREWTEEELKAGLAAYAKLQSMIFRGDLDGARKLTFHDAAAAGALEIENHTMRRM